jgi:antitoxin component of MazEF toxin-antitoxin module
MIFKNRKIFNSGKILVVSIPTVIEKNWGLQKDDTVDLQAENNEIKITFKKGIQK